jgi:uncharacterized membrane protein YdjX (TVP38/TMEM64 family)
MTRSGALARLWPLLLLLTLLAVAAVLGLGHLVSWHELAGRQQALQTFAAERPVLAAASFVLLYAGLTAISFPGAVLLTMAGGLVFGTVGGAFDVIVGATAGATLAFLAARHALGGWFARRSGVAIERIRPGLERDGFSYLLALRLLPVVPFWLVNLAAGAVRIDLGSFILATALGITPATILFASVGHGLGAVVAAGHTPDASIILRPVVVLPLAGLALLSLAPVAWRRHRRMRAGVG